MPWRSTARYDADGNPVKGDYARIFEEEYRRLAKHPDYQSLFKEVDLTTDRRGSPQRLFLDRQEEGRTEDGRGVQRHQGKHDRPTTKPTA